MADACYYWNLILFSLKEGRYAKDSMCAWHIFLRELMKIVAKFRAALPKYLTGKEKTLEQIVEEYSKE